MAETEIEEQAQATRTGTSRRPMSRGDRMLVRMLRKAGGASTRDRLGPQRDRVQRLLDAAAADAGLETPTLLSGRGKRGKPNAAAISVFGHRFVIVDRLIAERMDDRELGAVLAHEMAHLKLRHHLRAVPQMAAQAALGVTGKAVGAGMSGAFVLAIAGFIPWGEAMHAAYTLWKVGLGVSGAALATREAGLGRARGFEAESDMEAARVTDDPMALASALLVLQTGNSSKAGVERQAKEQVEALAMAQPGWRHRVAHAYDAMGSNHPSIHDRVRDLVDVARERGKLPADTLDDPQALAGPSAAVFEFAAGIDDLLHPETRVTLDRDPDASFRHRFHLRRKPVAHTDHGIAGQILSIIPPPGPNVPAIVEVQLNRPLSKDALDFLSRALGGAAKGDSGVPAAFIVARHGAAQTEGAGVA